MLPGENAAGRLLCRPCFQPHSRLCWARILSLSLSTRRWPSLSRSRFCWYSWSCWSSSPRVLSNSSSCDRHSLSRSCSRLALASCSRCCWSHWRCQRRWSCWNWDCSLWMLASSSRCFSRLRYFSWSWKGLPLKDGPGERLSCCWRSSLWTWMWLSWMVKAACESRRRANSHGLHVLMLGVLMTSEHQNHNPFLSS